MKPDLMTARVDTEMHTISGIGIRLDDPTSVSFELEDIAHALSNICRFNGHVTAPYSVLSHSLCAYDLAPLEHKLEALLHDAAEAYIGDIIVPVKELFPAIAKYEDILAGMIFQKFAPSSDRIEPITVIYKKSNVMKALDKKLGNGESSMLRPNLHGVYDAEVDRLMNKHWHATPRDFIERYMALEGSIEL